MAPNFCIGSAKVTALCSLHWSEMAHGLWTVPVRDTNLYGWRGPNLSRTVQENVVQGILGIKVCRPISLYWFVLCSTPLRTTSPRIHGDIACSLCPDCLRYSAARREGEKVRAKDFTQSCSDAHTSVKWRVSAGKWSEGWVPAAVRTQPTLFTQIPAVQAAEKRERERQRAQSMQAILLQLLVSGGVKEETGYRKPYLLFQLLCLCTVGGEECCKQPAQHPATHVIPCFCADS